MTDYVSFIPLGGIGDVTKNMYIYGYRDELVIVDCGLGFPDETMIGVDLLLPDITYLLSAAKKIVGMVITHGHEDHFGGLPFILPQLPNFPIFASPLTSSFANEKLKEFGIESRVKSVSFEGGEISLGSYFKALFIHVTHSVPDTSHIVLKTPVGTIYHGSDFKFDQTPYDQKPSDKKRIEEVGRQGVLCLLSDCLGSERKDKTKTEQLLNLTFEQEMRRAKGKFIVTTYSSNISRLQQIIDIGVRFGKKVCFFGRSMIKTKDMAVKLGYLTIPKDVEIYPEELGGFPDSKLLLFVAGSQGQQESALTRMVNDEIRDITISSSDTVIFSSDPIPGNEVSVYDVIDTLAKREVRVLYSDVVETLHVSGHGSSQDLIELIKLTRPRILIPIGGAYRHMAAYKDLAMGLGYSASSIYLLENGEQLLLAKDAVKKGKKVEVKSVYVDAISGEEVESFVLRDRQKLSEGGIVIVLAEIDSSNYRLIAKPDLVIRGFNGVNITPIKNMIYSQLQQVLRGKNGKIKNWPYLRRVVGDVSERVLFKKLRRRPLVLPVVIEV